MKRKRLGRVIIDVFDDGTADAFDLPAGCIPEGMRAARGLETALALSAASRFVTEASNRDPAKPWPEEEGCMASPYEERKGGRMSNEALAVEAAKAVPKPKEKPFWKKESVRLITAWVVLAVCFTLLMLDGKLDLAPWMVLTIGTLLAVIRRGDNKTAQDTARIAMAAKAMEMLPPEAAAKAAGLVDAIAPLKELVYPSKKEDPSGEGG